MTITLTQLISSKKKPGFIGALTEATFTVYSMEVARFFPSPTGWGISEQVLNRQDVKRVAIRTPGGRIIAEVEDFKGSGIHKETVDGETFRILPIEAWQYQRSVKGGAKT